MTRWRCRSCQPLLVDYVDGALAEAARRRLERHLARCADCSADVTALREVPPLLVTSTVPDPGEAFWRQQRETIASAIRNLPGPRHGWQLDRLRDLFRLPAWRYPLAVAASVLVALLVYRFAERAQAPQTGATVVQVAQLDSDSLAQLHDLAQALVPADGAFARVSSQDDETMLAALPVGDLVGVSAPLELPRTADLDESELEGIGDLIGGLG